MATQPPPDAPSHAGAKFVTNKRAWRFNPYQRPPPPQPPKSPNFISALIFPASRKIASGAAKIFSSVFVSDSSSDSSQDSSDEEDVNSDNDRDILSYGVNGSDLDPEVGVEEHERKHVIQQLLMQETFSREESDRLVKIINSRVVEHLDDYRGKNVTPADLPGKTVDSVTPVLAVMEAKRWYKQRKTEQSSVSDLGCGSSGLNSAMLQHMEYEVGSPVDMAKSYMRARPPCSSPSAERIDLRTPSTMITRLTTEGNLSSVWEGSFSPSKKRNSLLSGACWNIQDEIRRVRSKATEDMLHLSPSSKFDPSLFSLSPRTSQDHRVTVARAGDKANELKLSIQAKSVDGSAEMAAGTSTNIGISALDIRDGVIVEAVLSNHGTYVPEQKQDMEVNQTEREHTLSDQSVIPDRAADITDTNLSSRNGSKVTEVNKTAETQNANGIQDKCVLLSEMAVEVPIMDETGDVGSGSQNSYEEPPEGQSQPEGEHDLAGNSDVMITKQQRKRPIRNTRKGRGRGKSIG